MFTADNIKSKLDLLTLLTNNYLNNQEEAVKQELLDFLHDDNNKALFETLAELTGYDFRDYDTYVEEFNIDKLQYLISLANQAKDYIDKHPELFISLNKEEISKTITDLRNKISSFITMADIFAPDDIEELKELINSLLSKDAYVAIKSIIKIKTGVDFDSYINLIYSGIFIDFGQIYLNYYLNELIDNMDFLEELSKEDVLEILNNIEKYLDDVKRAIASGKQDLIDIAINVLNEYLGSDKVKFVVELLEKYLKEKFELIIDKIYNPEDIEMILIIINGTIEGLEEYLTLPDRIASGEAKLKAARSQLENALKEYDDANRLLAEKQRELINGEDDIRQQISDARKQLSEKQEEATKKIEKARDDIKNKNYNWIVQGRDALISFVLLKYSIQSTSSSGIVFGSLFMFIIALVSFSTIAIIVEEEKRSVGTTKAFGFYNREILGKYLIFGVTGAILGVILGIILGFALCHYVLADTNKGMMFTLGEWILNYSIPVFVMVGLGIVLLNVLATFLACFDLLKSPAALLMKGDTIASRKRKQKKKNQDDDSNGSLYSKLIIRNMFNEKARVLTSIFIIAASCFMIGVAFSISDGFKGMYNRQAIDIYKYDFKIQYNDNITEEEKNKIIKVLNNYGSDYLDARYAPYLYEKDHNLSGIYLLTADDRIQDYVSVTDNNNKPIILPDDGLLVQNKMYEAYGVKDGDILHLYNTSLDDYNLQIKGGFKNYHGRFMVCSKQAYRRIFNEDPKNNTMFVLLNKADYETVTKELLSLSNTYTIEKNDNYKLRLESSLSLFSLVVVVITAIAIIMSFMILTNLANIFFARKKNELTIMRINGFTIKQTKQYLIKETIITIVIGILLGLILGYFLTLPIIKTLEQQDVMYVRDLDVKGWLIAIAVESIFAFMIYTLVFKKVEKLNFREIT